MITCAECVRELKTARLSDIRAGSPVALHYGGCENCSRLVHDLYHSERSLGAALDAYGPGTNSSIVAEKAIDSMYRRRKSIARAVRVLLALFGVGVLITAIAVRSDDGRSWQGEIIELDCMTGANASRIAERFMVSGETTIALRDDEKTIVLEGYRPEVIEAASQIAVADRGECQLTPAPSEVIVSPGKSGKD